MGGLHDNYLNSIFQSGILIIRYPYWRRVIFVSHSWNIFMTVNEMLGFHNMLFASIVRIRTKPFLIIDKRETCVKCRKDGCPVLGHGCIHL